MVGCLSSMQDACYPSPKGSWLGPAAVCQRRIVGRRWGEVPLLVCCVKSCPMSKNESVRLLSGPYCESTTAIFPRWFITHAVTYLAITTTAGGRLMTVSFVGHRDLPIRSVVRVELVSTTPCRTFATLNVAFAQDPIHTVSRWMTSAGIEPRSLM